ncbi:thioredoxin reductase (NADPH) [Streptoalloteichus tenebrarius]|uniref:Thioredoxin reductase (NADPH) n=1 Tax=Streptoalloteichus tenebrarius (strain ATCC 17920 / DSM 40477 / JCM 4838 / CBS 697.72 / NBRC 16177 / NCIMB 11028 / NRRL B-12390 / A12253. 1 / ISP 5477) TaxID=1933 RepID=A0ABT1I416_STRSD|nr:NAD(P)/FAD-dependent oxidoreductase [Streptoalloteichus tenebrarius]MCP2262544.1 thioredoxin reductase (NADPH) [Streptoalloteichus tenebrarius]BFE98658.1 NAD(P)/FAD-dependent oxidoreductase [Streptoalloteichus tenebrarius]
MKYDVVVVGGGVAGLTAGLVLARARRRVLVVDAGEPRNTPAAHLHNFLSRDGMPPAELLTAGRDEVTAYGGEVIKDRVVGVERDETGGFLVRRANGPDLTARAVLVATGLRDELPEIPGVRERWGRDVVHCPYCHGYEVRDTPIAVLGGDNRPFTLHQASLVRQWSEDVVFFPNRIALTDEERERLAARGVEVVDGEVARLVVAEDRVRGVELGDGRVVARATVFVGPRFVPRDELLRDLGCAVGDNGWVSVDPTGRTSVAGVWAAGNAVDSPAQLVNAASAGSSAAIAINHHLLALEVDQAVAERRGRDGAPAAN